MAVATINWSDGWLWDPVFINRTDSTAMSPPIGISLMPDRSRSAAPDGGMSSKVDAFVMVQAGGLYERHRGHGDGAVSETAFWIRGLSRLRRLGARVYSAATRTSVRPLT